MKECKCGKLIGDKRTLCVSCTNEITDKYLYQVQYRSKSKIYSNYFKSFATVEECEKFVDKLKNKDEYGLLRIVKIEIL